MGFFGRLFGLESRPTEAEPHATALISSTSTTGSAVAGPIVVKNPAQDDNDTPKIRREPPINIAPSFVTVKDCSDVITVLDYGQFQLASWLIEQMRWYSRLRGVQNTRLDGLIGTEIRWEPGKNNDLARRAARDIVEDWPLIATTATRKQLSGWGLDLGVGFAQMHWYESPSSGRLIPRLEAYHPQWALWDWSLRAYRIFTQDGWAVVPSPALSVPGEAWQPMNGLLGNQALGGYSSDSFGQGDTPTLVEPSGRWVVHEPFGQHSWRHGLIHAAWSPWLQALYGTRDLARGSEKLGIGIVKVSYPKATDGKALATLISGIRSIGSEGVLPVEVYPEESGLKSYNVEPFEWSGNGADWVKASREAANSELAILYLGHNTTAETKGASVGASAQVGNLIRGDIRVGDCTTEKATMYLQVLQRWAEVNYGDPGVAPVPVYVTDPPGENQAAAQTLLNISLALQNFDKSVQGLDKTELLNRFRVPMEAGGVTDAPPPAPPAAGITSKPIGSGGPPDPMAPKPDEKPAPPKGDDK